MKRTNDPIKILREVRRILQTPEGASIQEHAWSIMQELEIKRGDPNIQKIIDENKYKWERIKPSEDI